jgi:hypothetical protein
MKCYNCLDALEVIMDSIYDDLEHTTHENVVLIDKHKELSSTFRADCGFIYHILSPCLVEFAIKKSSPHIAANDTDNG